MAEYTMISAVIPHRAMNDEIDNMLHKCVDSLRGHSELLIVVNEIGFGPASNMGVRLSNPNSDFICIINNDTEMFGDWTLEDLADPDAVSFPYVNGVKQEFSGAFLCIPKWVIDKRGGYVYDERYKVGFWEDVDFWWWLKQEEIPFRQKDCGVTHPKPGSTMRYMDKKIEQENKERFLAKWNELPLKNWV